MTDRLERVAEAIAAEIRKDNRDKELRTVDLRRAELREGESWDRFGNRRTPRHLATFDLIAAAEAALEAAK